AGLLRGDEVAELAQTRDRLACRRDDDVAAELVALARENHLGRSRLETRLGCAAARLHALHEQAPGRGEPEDPGQVAGDRRRADTEKRTVDMAFADQLGYPRFARVRRDREADADVTAGVARAAGLDLRV